MPVQTWLKENVYNPGRGGSRLGRASQWLPPVGGTMLLAGKGPYAATARSAAGGIKSGWNAALRQPGKVAAAAVAPLGVASGQLAQSSADLAQTFSNLGAGAGSGLGGLFEGTLGGAGRGLGAGGGAALAGIGTGFGEGAYGAIGGLAGGIGGGAATAGSGIGEGVKSLILPALLVVGVAFLAMRARK